MQFKQSGLTQNRHGCVANLLRFALTILRKSWQCHLLLLSSLIALPVMAAAKPDIDQRITRLETIIANEFNTGMLKQMEAQQQDLSELRGKLEELQNELQLLAKKQEKLFLNLDSRIGNKENNNQSTEQIKIEPQANQEPPSPQVEKFITQELI